MFEKSVSSLLLAASLFSGLVLTGAATEALAEPLRTSSPTQSQVRPGLNPASPPQTQIQSVSGTTAPVAWPPGPPCDSDLLPPGHWGAPCIIRVVGDGPFN